MNLVMFPVSALSQDTFCLLTWRIQDGTLSYSKEATLLPLKIGAVVVTIEAGFLPLVPVVIANSSHAFHSPEKRFSPGTIRVKVLPPMETHIEDGEMREDAILRILEDVGLEMQKALEDISVV